MTFRLHRPGDSPQTFRGTRLSTLVSKEPELGVIFDTFWVFCDDENERATEAVWLDGDVVEQLGSGFGRSRFFKLTAQGELYEVEKY